MFNGIRRHFAALKESTSAPKRASRRIAAARQKHGVLISIQNTAAATDVNPALVAHALKEAKVKPVTRTAHGTGLWALHDVLRVVYGRPKLYVSSSAVMA